MIERIDTFDDYTESKYRDVVTALRRDSRSDADLHGTFSVDAWKTVEDVPEVSKQVWGKNEYPWDFLVRSASAARATGRTD